MLGWALLWKWELIFRLCFGCDGSNLKILDPSAMLDSTTLLRRISVNASPSSSDGTLTTSGTAWMPKNWPHMSKRTQKRLRIPGRQIRPAHNPKIDTEPKTPLAHGPDLPRARARVL